ncbi:flagellar hook-basal body complex protein FliE [Helicobacter sp. 10-6591]|uniref:flagellar hook-basal body complex protein FliE n=1 Tax=Helicobacter sp. 10-6591 TaxID=2004998 RepID=UPI000DCC478C|nr:flagellar hook-basal body complex protein FliE [Helicobacter sp. 10-6591]RAX55822.1 flagellar hook-basal body complex protein FliE [Helicobacter sp. 10-6591]
MANQFGVIKSDIVHADTNSIKTNHNPAKLKQNGFDFTQTLKQNIDSVNALQQTSEKALADMATGQIKDLHEAAIAINKAENSMKVMLEVRNKAINAYKEIMRTQI